MLCFFLGPFLLSLPNELPVDRLFRSGVSSSKLLEFDVAEGVLDPVRAGDCKGDSLFGEAVVSPEWKFAFSLPVTASDIARRPSPLDFFEKKDRDWEGAAGEGDARPWEDDSLGGMRGEFAIASILGESYSGSLVTVGGTPFTGFSGRTNSKLLELRWLLMLEPK